MAELCAPTRQGSYPVVYILVGEHFKELLLLLVIEATGVNPFFRVLVCTEQHVPQGDVAVVVLWRPYW